MALNMEPQVGDTSINIPVTFDYRGGRGGNKRNKIIATAIIIVVVGILLTGITLNHDIEILKKCLLDFLIFYVGLVVLRFIIFRELYFSDIYEELLESDLVMDITQIWQIFEVGNEYPYICYYKNGYKGIFVKMEKGTVTGKTIENEFIHYDAIGEAYNLAHALNMNIIHIDYMDNVGKDIRLQKLYEKSNEISNPDMQMMMIDIYNNWQAEMSINYASYDIYLFLTRDKLESFVYNMQNVVGAMLGGNYITYRVLNRNDLSSLCTALFNLHTFSVNDACEQALVHNTHNDIVPIKVTHLDGSVDILNKTKDERRFELEERVRKQKEAKEEQKARKKKEKLKKKGVITDSKNLDADVDLFSESNEQDKIILKDTSNLDSTVNLVKPNNYNNKDSISKTENEDLDLF